MRCSLVVAAALCSSAIASTDDDAMDLIMDQFKGEDMLWGAATAAGQVEGAAHVDGKQYSIWDDFCKSVKAVPTEDNRSDTSSGVLPHKCGHGDFISTLRNTDQFYDKYKEDVDMLADLGFNSLRLSISWPRVFPKDGDTGKHKANPEGIKFYKDVFARLKEKNVVPMVTLFHWDLPNDLSWLDDGVVQEYVDYANLCFENFPEITHWATFNEPASFCNLGYSIGAFAPGHKSTTDHLVCSHHVLQAHGRAVKSYREKYQKASNGKIGIVLDYKWAYPATDSEEDQTAAKRDRENVVGIWADPIFLTGDYPQGLKGYFGERLPALSQDDQKILKGSADFYGVNTYGGKIAIWTNKTIEDYKPGSQIAERYSWSPCDPTAPDIAQKKVQDPKFECGADSSWLWAYPDAMKQYLEYVSDRYKVDIFITEFGVDVKNESSLSREDVIHDPFRIKYYKRYLAQAAKAKKDGVPIKGVFAWSLMDNLEWSDGLAFRFGLVYVDFNDKENRPRTPKDSAKWWSDLIKNLTSNTPSVTPSGQAKEVKAATEDNDDKAPTDDNDDKAASDGKVKADSVKGCYKLQEAAVCLAPYLVMGQCKPDAADELVLNTLCCKEALLPADPECDSPSEAIPAVQALASSSSLYSVQTRIGVANHWNLAACSLMVACALIAAFAALTWRRSRRHYREASAEEQMLDIE